jgi:hypothetical protein
MTTRYPLTTGFVFLINTLLLATSSACSLGSGEDRWSSVEGGAINALAMDPVTPTTLYAGTVIGVFKSTDGGGNWTLVNTGLTEIYTGVWPGLTNTEVHALAIDPAAPGARPWAGASSCRPSSRSITPSSPPRAGII